MDIANTSLFKQSNASGRNASVNARATDLESPRIPGKLSTSDLDGDKDNSQAKDSATISSAAYSLASTSVVSGVTTETRIPDPQKAKQVAGDIVSAINDNPADAQKAVNGASLDRVANLLAA